MQESVLIPVHPFDHAWSSCQVLQTWESAKLNGDTKK